MTYDRTWRISATLGARLFLLIGTVDASSCERGRTRSAFLFICFLYFYFVIIFFFTRSLTRSPTRGFTTPSQTHRKSMMSKNGGSPLICPDLPYVFKVMRQSHDLSRPIIDTHKLNLPEKLSEVHTFDDWIYTRCQVKPRRARQLRKFYKLFSPYKKLLRCKLSFIWFEKNGLNVVKYFESHQAVAMPWTHEIDRVCGICM